MPERSLKRLAVPVNLAFSVGGTCSSRRFWIMAIAERAHVLPQSNEIVTRVAAEVVTLMATP